MAQITGKYLSVTVGGSTVNYATGWSMNVGADILRHRGASEAATTKYIGEQTRTGSFNVESDPDDSLQASLMAAVQQGDLVLYEDGGTSHALTAIISPSVTFGKSGRPMRRFDFEEVG